MKKVIKQHFPQTNPEYCHVRIASSYILTFCKYGWMFCLFSFFFFPSVKNFNISKYLCVFKQRLSRLSFSLLNLKINLCCQSGNNQERQRAFPVVIITNYHSFACTFLTHKVHSNTISFFVPSGKSFFPLPFLNPFVAQLNQVSRTLLTSFHIPFVIVCTACKRNKREAFISDCAPQHTHAHTNAPCLCSVDITDEWMCCF